MARELYHALDETDRVLRAWFDPMAHAFTGALRLGVAVALVVAVTVEIAANPNGMGYAMMIAQQSLNPALMLAWLGWIGAPRRLVQPRVPVHARSPVREPARGSVQR